MKRTDARKRSTLARAAATFSAVLPAKGEPVHQLTSIHILSNHALQLEAGGFVAPNNAFRNFFEIVPIQSSSNFQDWTGIGTLLRTNLTTDALSLSDPLPLSERFAFYRAAATQF